LVELEGDLEEIRVRKNTESVAYKPTKGNIANSKERLNSFEGEILKDNYLKINNTNLSAKETAEMIQLKFQL